MLGPVRHLRKEDTNQTQYCCMNLACSIVLVTNVSTTTVMKKCLYLCLLSYMAVASIYVKADDLSNTQEISLGYIEFPPVFSTNEAGAPEGLLIDLAKMVIPKAGYRWTAHSRPTKRMATNIVNGDLDLWIGLSTLPEFKNTTLVGLPVVSTIELNAYWLGDKPAILTKEDLSGKQIITVHGFSYGGWVNYIQNPANNVTECRSFTHKQAVNMLKHNRCDYLLNYSGPMKNMLKQVPIDALNKSRVSTLEARFVVSKKTPNAQRGISSPGYHFPCP